MAVSTSNGGLALSLSLDTLFRASKLSALQNGRCVARVTLYWAGAVHAAWRAAEICHSLGVRYFSWRRGLDSNTQAPVGSHFWLKSTRSGEAIAKLIALKSPFQLQLRNCKTQAVAPKFATFFRVY